MHARTDPKSFPSGRTAIAKRNGRQLLVLECREQTISGRVDLVAVVAFKRRPCRLIVRESRSRQATSPSRFAVAVESTRSVKSSVTSARLMCPRT